MPAVCDRDLVSLVGTVLLLTAFPKHDPEELLHTHPALFDSETPVTHSHRFVIDHEHRHWPDA